MPLDASNNCCLSCGYILGGLTESRCPECGRTFDLNDPTTYRASSPAGPWMSGTRWIAAVGWTHLLVLAVSAFDVWFRIPGEWYPLGACALDSIGKLAALTSPVILLACALTKRRGLLWLGWADLLLGIIWVASAIRLLGHV